MVGCDSENTFYLTPVQATGKFHVLCMPLFFSLTEKTLNINERTC